MSELEILILQAHVACLVQLSLMSWSIRFTDLVDNNSFVATKEFPRRGVFVLIAITGQLFCQ